MEQGVCTKPQGKPLLMCLRFPLIGEKMREVEAYLYARSCSRDSNRGIFSETQLVNADGGAGGLGEKRSV